MCDNNCKYKLLPDKMQIFRKIILTLHLTDYPLHLYIYNNIKNRNK